MISTINNKQYYMQSTDNLDKAISVLNFVEAGDTQLKKRSDVLNVVWLLQDLLNHAKCSLESIQVENIGESSH
ncbi:MAG: hypothetical protein DHS20C10_13680 [marine bacterium B5-7]|nr:MAG: hypothetical protein DHS20C10_13680 [marine bacterium B5-7]